MATRLADLRRSDHARASTKGLHDLSDEFAGTFSAETVERYIAESLGSGRCTA